MGSLDLFYRVVPATKGSFTVASIFLVQVVNVPTRMLNQDGNSMLEVGGKSTRDPHKKEEKVFLNEQAKKRRTTAQSNNDKTIKERNFPIHNF